jgi:hypothetical protein
VPFQLESIDRGPIMDRFDDARRNGTSPAARTIANVVLISAGVGVGYLLMKHPPLRRLARTALRAWLGAGIPAFLLTEIGRAWVESGSRPPKSERPVQTVT